MDDVRGLLTHPNFKPSASARADLEQGVVDPRLVNVLRLLVHTHQIAVSIIKTDHPMGPTTPSGRVNAHYYGRVADIVAVNGKSIAGSATAPDVVEIGRILHALAPADRPDSIMGPQAWHTLLDYPASAGFISDAFHTAIHVDHLHIGFEQACGTRNQH